MDDTVQSIWAKPRTLTFSGVTGGTDKITETVKVCPVFANYKDKSTVASAVPVESGKF